MQLKHILGTVTIIAIIGGTIYAIKKAKDLEKTEGEEITLAEAKEMIGARRENDEVVQLEEDFSGAMQAESALRTIQSSGVHKIKGIKADLIVIDELVEEEDDQDELMEDLGYEGETDVYIHKKITEEDKVLRHEPNSRDARNQFIKMELADWVPLEDVYQTLQKLFEFPFQPQNDGDHDLMTRIIDYRAQFFGFESRWSKDVTFADIILYYSRSADFNCGEGVRHWVEYFLDFNELDLTTPSHLIDEVLNNLNAHVYFNEERQTFGLFGLTRESMDQAIRIANRNVDRSVTYDIEFNEFLKSCL